jgi:ribokinase
VKTCKIVYVGEVFVEVASTIANFAKNSGKTVIYRPGVLYLKQGIEKIRDILEYTDILITNELGWEVLKENSDEKLVEVADLQKFGPKTVILTKGSEGCEVWVEGRRFAYSLPKKLVKKFKVVDPTGAGDSFSAALIKKILNGSSFEEAIRFAQVAACITCSRVGASPAFPTLREIKNFG